MKIWIVGSYEIVILGPVRGAVGHQDVPADFAGIMLGGEQVAAQARRKGSSLVTQQTAQGHGGKGRDRRQRFASEGQRSPFLGAQRVTSAGDEVNQGVAQAADRLL